MVDHRAPGDRGKVTDCHRLITEMEALASVLTHS